MNQSTNTLRGCDIKPGAIVPPLQLDVTATMIVAASVASRDFMPIHNDAQFASAQGLPNVIMNILTTNGYLERFITEWAGPETLLKQVKFRLGLPVMPGQAIRFDGEVLSKKEGEGECLLELAIKVSSSVGDHANGTMGISIPQ